MAHSRYYTKQFFEALRDESARSANIVVPLLLQLLPARSVVDVGCGDGAWLAAFRQSGVLDIFGIDGDYVDREILQIPRDRFQAADLSKPLLLDRSFDLAISLEVAEHLPLQSASCFVESLTRLAPAVLFSAAIPFQGGVHHLNEQWPDAWAARFALHGYLPVDFLRRKVWRNSSVGYWYAQNTILFVSRQLLDTNPLLQQEFERTDPEQLSLVHPKLYEHRQLYPAFGVRQASRVFLLCLKNAVTVRLQSLRSYFR